MAMRTACAPPAIRTPTIIRYSNAQTATPQPRRTRGTRAYQVTSTTALIATSAIRTAAVDDDSPNAILSAGDAVDDRRDFPRTGVGTGGERESDLSREVHRSGRGVSGWRPCSRTKGGTAPDNRARGREARLRLTRAGATTFGDHRYVASNLRSCVVGGVRNRQLE